MKIISAVILLTVLSGCLPDPMTNEQIIEENGKCADEGLGVYLRRFQGNLYIFGVQCVPVGASQ